MHAWWIVAFLAGGLELFEIPMAVMEDGQYKSHSIGTTASGEVQAEDHDSMLTSAISGAMGHPILEAPGAAPEDEQAAGETEADESEVEDEMMTQEECDGIWHQVTLRARKPLGRYEEFKASKSSLEKLLQLVHF